MSQFHRPRNAAPVHSAGFALHRFDHLRIARGERVLYHATWMTRHDRCTTTLCRECKHSAQLSTSPSLPRTAWQSFGTRSHDGSRSASGDLDRRDPNPRNDHRQLPHRGRGRWCRPVIPDPVWFGCSRGRDGLLQPRQARMAVTAPRRAVGRRLPSSGQAATGFDSARRGASYSRQRARGPLHASD
jgi:hypothetical protein